MYGSKNGCVCGGEGCVKIKQYNLVISNYNEICYTHHHFRVYITYPVVFIVTVLNPNDFVFRPTKKSYKHK